ASTFRGYVTHRRKERSMRERQAGLRDGDGDGDRDGGSLLRNCGEGGVRAALLDVDGTLIDSNDAHARAWVDVGDELGYDIEFGHVRWLVGMGGDRVLPELTGLDEESEEGKRVLERRGEIFRSKYLPRLNAFPRARDLLERLRADDWKLVVATSASAKDLKALLEQAGRADLSEDATTAGAAGSWKRACDCVRGWSGWGGGRRPGSGRMRGDGRYGVRAGLRAGVRMVALRCGGWSDGERRGASEIWEDPAELLAGYDRSLF